LKELRRLASGPFNISTSATLEKLEEAARLGELDSLTVSPYAALSHLPELLLNDAGVMHVRHGRSPGWADVTEASPASHDETVMVRLTWNGELVAVAQCMSGADAVPRILLKRVFI
jgi:tRNA U55 pseudouridine synthase TruB